jgi:hypothetical protein
MAYFAKLGTGNIVEQVISINNAVITDNNGIEQEQLGVDFINNLYNTRDVWKQTSYNTRGGKYYNLDNTLGDQSKSFRKNYAGIGYTYNETRDAFIPPKPFNSWVLNETTYDWEAPVARPEFTQEQIDNKSYCIWNESILNWDIRTV